MTSDRTKRRVVCAAIYKQLPDGGDVIVIGPRHFDNFMHSCLVSMGIQKEMRDAEQGFIDQWGKFMSRKEAFQVAMQMEQFIDTPIHQHELFSEDLY